MDMAKAPIRTRFSLAHATPRASAARVALIYAAAGVLWITFSDAALISLITDHELQLRLQTTKGWIFVATTAVLVYLLVSRLVHRLAEARISLEEEVKTRTRELEQEIVDRIRAEEALQEVNEGLEQRVRERTHALTTEVRERRKTEEMLTESERRLTTLISNLPGMVYRCRNDLEWTMDFVSGGSAELTGYAPEDLVGNRVVSFGGDVVHPDDREGVWQTVQAALDRRAAFQVVYRIRDAAGAVKWVWEQGRGVFTEKGDLVALEGFIFDISERKAAEDELRKLSQAVEQNLSAVAIVDASGAIEYGNPRFISLLGHDITEFVGQKMSSLQSGLQDSRTGPDLEKIVEEGSNWRGELHVRTKSNRHLWCDTAISPIRTQDGTISNFLLVMEDVTVRKEYEERLVAQANFDQLTGLPNRLLAADRLARTLERARITNTGVALIYVGLDGFGKVNASLGHEAGDRLLLQVAARLKSVTPRDGTLARFGADEFLVIAPEIGTSTAASRAARLVLDTIVRPFRLSEQEVYITASLGISLFPDDGSEPSILLRNANGAARRAKQAGGSKHEFFTQELNAHAMDRLRIESRLRHATAKGELTLAYQPIVNIQSGEITGAEGLLRWQDPEKGAVPPNVFIPIAEETDLIVELGAWALEAACRDAAKWRADVGRDIRIAVNISERQLTTPGFIEVVGAALERSNLPASCLELEITERVLVDETAITLAVLNEIEGMGVKLAIDDFGTGYSALSYLQRYPFHTLKVDRSFIAKLAAEDRDRALVSAIIAMAHSLGLTVVAEGVEDEHQLRFLKESACERAQGFFFAKPLPNQDFAHQLRALSRSPPTVTPGLQSPQLSR